MPNGPDRPEAKTSARLGFVSPSLARRTLTWPIAVWATKMSPLGATRMTRGIFNWTKGSTLKPGGTSGVAPAGWATTEDMLALIAVA